MAAPARVLLPRRSAPGVWIAMLLACAAGSARAQVPTLHQQAKLAPADVAPLDRFGAAVAVDRGWLAIGAPGAAGAAGPDAGAAYVFLRSGVSWTLDAKLPRPAAASDDAFGASIALRDGVLVVGAPRAEGLRGAAHVFERGSAGWVHAASLGPSDLAPGDAFGTAVVVDGARLLVGAPGCCPGPRPGRVHAYERVGGAWRSARPIVAPLAQPGARFGASLAIGGDRAAIGAPAEDGAASDAGAVYVAQRIGHVWRVRARLAAAGAGAGDGFGASVAVDGERLVVGAPGSDSFAQDSGAAHVFVRSGAGWNPDGVLGSPAQGAGDAFGRAVGLAGQRLLVAGRDAPSQLGFVSFLERVAGAWTESLRLQADDVGPADGFGTALSFTENFVGVGARRADDGGPLAGAAYTFFLPRPHESFCFGDGSGAPCPCGNEGRAGSGCRNSTGAGGRLYRVAGTSSLSTSDLELGVAELPPHKFALLVVSAELAAGGAGSPFADGLRCLGGAPLWLGIQPLDHHGRVTWGPGLAASAGWQPGDARAFQVWYRDPLGPCGTTTNTTNALRWVFTP